MNDQTHTESGLGSTSHPALPAALYRGGEQAAELLMRLFRRYPQPLRLRLWDGTSIRAGAATGGDPPFTLVFRTPEAVWSAILGRDPLALADAYFRGNLDIEGDFFAALSIKDHLDALQMQRAEKLMAAFAALRLRIQNASSRHAERLFAPDSPPRIKAHSSLENREAIHFPYDGSKEFYALWLDKSMVYSCAYFENPQIDLDSAQQ